MTDDYPPIFWTREQREAHEAAAFAAWIREQIEKGQDR